MKAHVEDLQTGKVGKTLCGREMPRDFNPWTTTLETCETCARVEERRRQTLRDAALVLARSER